MAINDIVMPQMGESITTGTITKWHKKAGDSIEIDEILLEISTDKVESEIPSPMAGRVEEILFEEGETIDVGVKIASIEDDTSVAFSGGGSSSKPAAAAASKEEVKQEAPAQSAATSTSDKQETGRKFYTPLVKSMAKKAGVSLDELSKISGTGAGGRVNKSDFENYLANGATTKTAPAASAPATSHSKPAAPAGVSQVTASGERVEIIPMGNMRKAIAKNMVQSKLTSPHVNSIDEIDMTHLVKFREGFKHEFKKQEGFSLTYTHFILYSLVQALKEFPMVNASVDEDILF